MPLADVFLSYARSNEGSARRVAQCLRATGFSVWFDENLPAHRAYSDVIEDQLEAAKAVLVLWSADAVKSHWVRSEANRGRQTGRLVQVRLDEARLPMPFDQIQCAELSKWSGDCEAPGWQRAIDSVAMLVGHGPDVGFAAATAPSWNRRHVMTGAGAAGIALVGGLAAWRFWPKPLPQQTPSEASPEAQLLLAKGLDALQQFDALDAEQPGSAAPAIALLTQATEADPDSAVAWGGLAMAYAAQRRASPPSQRPGLAERSRSAAARAFALDSHEMRALGALRMMDQVYHNWSNAEDARRRAVALYPTMPLHVSMLADVLGNVGRCREAAQVSLRADRTRFLIPGADRKIIVHLWAAGRLQEADVALQKAGARWPQHPQVWRTRLGYLLYSGRPSEALAMLDDAATRPDGIPIAVVDAARATAEALIGKGDPTAAVKANLAYLEKSPSKAPQVAQACAAVGDADTALALLRGYYFGEAPWASLAPPGGDEDRITASLFLPPMRHLWQTAPFDAMLTRIGLENYWQRSKSMPDFRRYA